MDPNRPIREILEERFAQLPKVLQDAILSTNVSQQLRTLADDHRLHLDQWEKLENEVMLTLYGFQQAEELPHNLESEVGVSTNEADALAADISRLIFTPIRQELERELEHPAAEAEKTSDIEDVRTEMLAGSTQKPSVPSVEQTPAAPVQNAASVVPA